MSRWVSISFVCAWAVLLVAGVCAADPLYLTRPFDEITLDENNAGVRLKVQPLALPGRKLPDPADRKDDLEIELVDRPGERFRLGWNNIAGIRFFEEMVLAEAQALIKDERFDEAYPYFQFLETKFPKTPGLKDAVENYLWAQIAGELKNGRNDAALALLVELHQRNPQRPGLSAALERVTVTLVEKHLAEENHRAARGLLRNLTQRYPAAAATAAPYETQMRDKAAARLETARQALAAGKFREAHQAARQALGIWPEVEGGRALAQEIHRKYPSISVAVTSLPEGAARSVAGDWAARRTQSLLAPRLFEKTSPAIDSSGYRSSFGEIVKEKNPRQIVFRLRPGTRWPHTDRPLTAHDVARWLLAASDTPHSSFDPAWAGWLASVAVRKDSEVLIELARPPLAPEALLHAATVAAGPFRVDAQVPEQIVFVRQATTHGGDAAPLSEVVERAYADSSAALEGLRRGEVSVVDRISPWELKSLASNKEIAVGRYALPSVHLLVPNPRRPLAANRTLKRAILYGIDRQSILRLALLDGRTIAGCQCLSGPFPRGEVNNDPHGYAYDEEVPVRPYDPGLALALAGISSPQSQADQKTAAADTAKPPLVIAHRAEPIARVACQSIARQLQSVGIPVTLRELPAAQPVGDDHDLLYVELPIEEPLLDVWRLFGPQGIAGAPSPAMLATLRELESAADVFQAAEKLRAIHRLAAAELPVIPLWQLVDHFAFHPAIKGLAPRPVSLYQDIDQWQVELRLPTE